MKVSFRKLPGKLDLSIAYFWELEITSAGDQSVIDHLIPELAFDYLYLQSGSVKVRTICDLDYAYLPNEGIRT
ncbi:MAG: hypothetical protein AAGD96_25005, partial [Chloroflexota bacterium]